MCTTLSDYYSNQQLKVSKLIMADLAKTENTVSYLKELDSRINDSESPYYLRKAVESSFSIAFQNITDPYSPKDGLTELKKIFYDNETVSELRIRPVTFAKNSNTKPFDNVLCDNLDQVIAKQNFNGEPFLQGQFGYMQVMLPTERLPLTKFYPVLMGILNGFYTCEGGDLERLTVLANQIYHKFAPKKYQTRGSKYNIASYPKIEEIVKKVLGNPQPFNGRTRTAKTIWNPVYQFTSEEKNAIINGHNGMKKKQGTLNTLQSVYREGMTQKELAENTGFSRSTVKAYWMQIRASNKKRNIDEVAKPENWTQSRLSLQPSTPKVRRTKMVSST
ncbi:helix-turn-helix domain-containing protein [Arenibacter palladensis]|uniref:helix-turn-helix domain-containing protein n=1 Tax=Arenibacter palladensis TaxID=237373 RepID=UPI0026E32187|nr:helix-turn-helix transcriptional regulator [Arenibacter palladensis]MDO6602001.1 helix-turn-helix transcriptional regulator [Arenibacter palladensis]